MRRYSRLPRCRPQMNNGWLAFQIFGGLMWIGALVLTFGILAGWFN